MTSHTTTTLSVVVCCYTEARWKLLLETIASVQAQLDPVHELIIVVDHNAALLERLRALDCGAVVVENGQAPGLSGARNSGIRAATGDVVAFLDDDAVAAPTWSRRLLVPYADPDILGVGGRIVPRFEGGRRPSWLPREFDWVIGCTYEGHRKSMGPVRNLIGANMSLRRSTFGVVGGFRSDLGRTGQGAAGCEETELCIRAAREMRGFMWYQPDAVVYHFVPKSRTTHRYFRERCLAEGGSKARIARLAGRQAGLASERKFATSTLPRAWLRELGLLVTGRRGGALARARALFVAVAMISVGYARARVTGAWRFTAEHPDLASFEPVYVTQLDADAPGEVRPAASFSGGAYRRARALVRWRGRPAQVLEFGLPEAGLDRDEVEALLAPVREAQAARPAELVPRRRPDADQPFVSVVIATRDRPDALALCLESLRAMTYEPFEVVVVDNASASDDTRKLVESIAEEDPSIRYVREERAGLARAHNRGVQEAAGSIVAFTDDDVVVDPRWLDTIVDAFHEDPAIGCVTGLIFPVELETLPQAWIERTVGFGKGFARRQFDLNGHRPDDPLFPFAAGAFGSGANMAFRAEALRAMKGFDPALGAGTRARGGDDLAAFFDVIAAGYAVVYEPAAIVHHAHRRDYPSLQRQAHGYGVGLGAYLAHVLVHHPAHARAALARLPRAAQHFLSSESPKNASRPGDFPRELVWRERLGVLAGPWAYVRSRRVTRGDDWVFEAPVAETEQSAAVVSGD